MIGLSDAPPALPEMRQPSRDWTPLDRTLAQTAGE
jgi:hypothetical protein